MILRIKIVIDFRGGGIEAVGFNKNLSGHALKIV